MEELLFNSLVDVVEDSVMIEDVLATLGREHWFIVSVVMMVSCVGGTTMC